jgi:pheromone shutdown protein TraB
MAAAPVTPRALVVGVAHVVNLEAPLRAALGRGPLDGVALELDLQRATALLEPPAGRRARAGVPVVFWLWALLQRRLGAAIGGGAAGEEMRVALRFADEKGLPVFFVDDPIQATIATFVRTIPFKERVGLLVAAVAGLFLPSRLVEGEVDHYTDHPEEFAEELRRSSPTLAHVLIDARNEHMADRISALSRSGVPRIAVVVGDAHVPGLASALRAREVAVETVPFRELRRATAPSPSTG